MNRDRIGSRSSENAFMLDVESEQLLLAATAEGDRGEVITAEQLMDKLRG